MLSTDSTLYQTWLSLNQIYKSENSINIANKKNNNIIAKESQHQNSNDNFNFNGRFYDANECLYNLVTSSSSTYYSFINLRVLSLNVIILQLKRFTSY
jgi:hypothetical protein